MVKQNEVSFSLMEDERYKKCWEKYQNLNSQMSELDQHVQDLLAEGNSQATDLQEQKVQALLDGENPDEIIQANWQKDYEKVLERRRLLMAAVERVKHELGAISSQVSKEICEKVAPKNLTIGREIYLALIQLGQGIVTKNNFYDELFQADIAYVSYLPILSNIRLGDPLDSSSFFAILLIEGVRQGFITEADIPKDWLDMWLKRFGFRFEQPKTIEKILTQVRKGKASEDASEWTLET